MDGAPIPQFDGGFLTDDRGQVVIPQLNPDALRRLALTGGGRFAQLTADDSDLAALFATAAVGTLQSDEDGEAYEADIWRDQGIWLTLLLLPIVALGFRRGWIYVLVAVVAFPTPQAQALTWRDLWLNPDQQGIAALETATPDVAAGLFEDPEWGAAASYRAGDYGRSAQRLAGIDTAEANYNRGNSLAKSGDLSAAIAAYDRALALDPGHEDADYNRALVQELLDQQEQEQQEQEQQDQSQSNESDQQQSQSSDEQGQQSDESQSDPGDQSQDQSSDTGEQRQADNQPSDSESDPADSEEQADNEGDAEQSEADQREMQASLRPEDVEEWASEQAADQWLRRIPQDPGGLLRRKFLYQYQRLGVDQEGNYVWPGDEAAPW
jgi:Ca-activated chloride channel family protein